MKGSNVFRSKYAVAGALAALMAAASALAAEGDPVGPEFIANTQVAGDQGATGGVATAALHDGGFVVVWDNEEGTSGSYDVAGQRFDAKGAPVGTEFAVVAGVEDQGYGAVAVAGLAGGGFVVAWDDYGAPGGLALDVAAQLFDNAGAPVGSAFLVNLENYGDREGAQIDVEGLADGSFVVAWYTDDYADVAARRFSSTGSALGTEFIVNTTVSGDQGTNAIDIAALKDGGFVVAWTDTNAPGGSSYDISARRFTSSGAAAGTVFRLNEGTSGNQGNSRVAVAGLESGGFVAAWDGVEGSYYDVGARIFNSAGAPQTGDFVVNGGILGYQGRTLAASGLQGGRFAIVWGDQAAPGGELDDVSAQIFDSTGAKVGSQFIVNSTLSDYQGDRDVAVTSLADGNFAVVWDDRPTSDYNVSGVVIEGPGCKAEPLDGCARPAKTLMKIKEDADPSKRQLLWKWLGGDIALPELGDPAGGETDYALCIYDDASLVSTPRIASGGDCGEKPCWKTTAVGFGYSNSATNGAGVFKLQLKSGTGNGKILLKARGANLAPPVPISQSSAVRVQLVRADGGACWESFFVPPATKDDANNFKDKEDTQPACGNATIEPGEDCEGSDLGSGTCVSVGFDGGVLACDAPTCKFDASGCYEHKLVFATSSTYDGAFNDIASGFSGADQICNGHAFLGGLPGTYKAWIGGADGSPYAYPVEDFTHSSHPYVLVDGTVVADDWADLVDGTLDNAINRYEDGAPVGGVLTAYTNVDAAGERASDDDCIGWTSGLSSSFSRYGLIGATSFSWTDHGSTTCNQSRRLYCFQQ